MQGLSINNIIQKFIKLNKIKKTIILTPDKNYATKMKLKKQFPHSKIKVSKSYTYSI